MPPPVPRLDAAAMVAALQECYDVELELVGAAPGGEVGAAYVRWPDGHDGVLTRVGDGSPAADARLRRTAEVLDLARAHGTPAPRYELIAPLDGAHALVQERLPGAEPAIVRDALVHELLAITATWTGLLGGANDLPPTSLHLRSSGPGFCLHASLAAHDDRTRSLLGRVQEVGRTVDELEGDDLVHLDLHAGNVLVDGDGRVTGIVDWDGWGRGDRWFSVEVLAFDLARRGTAGDTLAHLDDLLAAHVPPHRLRAYRAHLALRHVDWSIRHHGPDAVDRWLAIATTRLDAV